jgi:hypothetical protein
VNPRASIEVVMSNKPMKLPCAFGARSLSASR